MALLDNRTAQVNLAWDEIELASTAADVGFDVADFGFDIQEMETGAPPTLADTLREDMKKRSSWGKAKEYKEPCCDLTEHLQLHKRDKFYYTCIFKRSEKGIPLSEIKQQQNARLFAEKAKEIAKGLIQFGDRRDWCIITTAKRRHKQKNFAEMVSVELSALLGIPFHADVIESHGRDRINPDFRLVKEVQERNILLYDDILTTGSTLRHTVSLFPDRNVLCIVGIDNN